MAIKKKYILIGGRVGSGYGGEDHYVSPYRLAGLYKVNPEDCFVYRSEVDFHERGGDNLPEGIPRLRVMEDGDYSLPAVLASK